jgi:hypothetical protein
MGRLGGRRLVVKNDCFAKTGIPYGHIFQHTLAPRTDGFVRLCHGPVSCVVLSCLCENYNLNTGQALLANTWRVKSCAALESGLVLGQLPAEIMHPQNVCFLQFGQFYSHDKLPVYTQMVIEGYEKVRVDCCAAQHRLRPQADPGL